MKIHIGSDHAGYALKGKLIEHLRSTGHDIEDHGVFSTDRADYPDYAAQVARAVRDGSGSLGLLTCGSGIGMCIAANKVSGVRAVAAWNAQSAGLSRAHNNANILCLGERLVPEPDAIAAVDAFLNAEFEGGRHAPRVDKIAGLEKEEASGKVGPGGA